MTLDPRAKELARIIVNHSVEIKEGEIFLIQAEDTFKEFAEFMGELADDKGARTLHDYYNLNEKGAMIFRNDVDELEAESRRGCALAEIADASVKLNASSNPTYLEATDSEKIGDFEKIVATPFRKIIMRERTEGEGDEFQVKWCVEGYPSEGVAKNAGVEFEEYKNHVYGATNIDWQAAENKMKKIKETFDGAKHVHIYVPNQTDLHLSLEGRGARIDEGKHNMPGGEVFYGPVENSINGTIFFPYPTVREGKTIAGINLTYRDGEVVDFSAEENQSFLEVILSKDGVKKVGEFGIGCNYGIKQYTKDLLFDEKIGGTVHLALGNSYELPLESGGGLNNSDVHWDNVCDLRKNENNPGGALYVNDNLVQKDGVWLFK